MLPEHRDAAARGNRGEVRSKEWRMDVGLALYAS